LPKVYEAGTTAIAEQDIVELQIAMNTRRVLNMQVGERVRDVAKPSEGFVEGDGAGRLLISQALQ
jgi:hypothetical protein